MNLEIFNSSNVASIPAGKPTVRINTKAGMFSFSNTVAHKLKLTHPTYIEFAQDKDRPEDWYLVMASADNEKAFKLRFDKDERFNLNSTAMARKIQQSIPAAKELNSFYMIVSTEAIEIDGRKIYALITKSISK
ncbi:hypothetical protein GBO34_00945 [Roseivirga pacifica]|uniref:hypothetical protein n=1 Tax=Roseivirga pacifica TaxID=1267423 RepID=UPI0020965AA4|nr:hypothetical protein [Roseivirga pacifica]MCO6367880.1 hypothetical protein [Roseivirga pacifica]MCO6377252.1 hypothetical protein [Roseivirga pacifica]